MSCMRFLSARSAQERDRSAALLLFRLLLILTHLHPLHFDFWGRIAPFPKWAVFHSFWPLLEALKFEATELAAQLIAEILPAGYH